MRIRSALVTDLPLLYQVCLLTGDSGKDASGIYTNPDLLGEIYVGPYVALCPQSSYSLVDDSDKAVGYVLGAVDTLNFEQDRLVKWLPELQQKYRSEHLGIKSDHKTPDQELMEEIFLPSRPPLSILDEFPSHGHIDLHPNYQSKGWGVKMMDVLISRMKELNSPGIYLPVSRFNTNALGFYKKLGFIHLIDRGDETIIGMRL